MDTFTQTIVEQQPKPPQFTEHPPYIDLYHKNMEISRVYTNIINDLRWLISRMTNEENRIYIMNSYEVTNKYQDSVIYEFVSVMCEVRLSVKEYCYYIELETDSTIQKVIGSYNFRRMLRAAYRHTNYENTQHYLEDCISVYSDLNDHYSYFKNRIANANEDNAILLIEDAIVE